MPKPQLTTANIANALERTAGNVYLAAKALGVARSALYKKINESEELQQALADARRRAVTRHPELANADLWPTADPTDPAVAALQRADADAELAFRRYYAASHAHAHQ